MAALTGGEGHHFPTGEASLCRPHKVGKKLNAELAASFGLPGPFMTSRDVHLNRFERSSKGDVVLLQQDTERSVGQVIGHFSFVGQAGVCCVSCIAVWDIVSRTERGMKCRIGTPEHRFAYTRDIKCSLAWAGAGELVTVLLPLHLVCAPSP